MSFARKTGLLSAAMTLLGAANCTLILGVDNDYHLVGTGGEGGCASACCRASDCTAPESPCEEARCEQGACTAVNKAKGTRLPDAEQTKGDCQALACDGAGKAVAEADDGDAPEGVDPCTIEACSAGVKTTAPADKGTSCALAGGGAGVCDGAGACVECNQKADCKDPALPFCATGKCVSHDCTNDAMDGDETDVDCGGADCPRCGDGKGCGAGADCTSGVCNVTKHCAAPSCTDQVMNGGETDVDCGEVCPTRCALGRGCATGDDCASQSCCSGACIPVAGGIAAGQGLHSCAWMTDAHAFCWGYNGGSALGDGTMFGPIANVGKATPVQVKALDGVVEIVTGGHHSCARKDDGTLWCWGYNQYGQLGIGATGGPGCTGKCQPSPIQMTALGNAVAGVSAGFAHTCARKDDGTLWCTGLNIDGQIGDGTKMNRTSPVQVTALGNTVAEVATGDHHSCARKDDGTLWCWGTNDDGELGDGTKTAHPTPVQVTALGNAVAGVAAGFAHTCAIKNDGTLWCWGRNDRGQLGNGTTIGSASPVKVTALGTTVLAVSAGVTHTCARRTNGYAYCWGANENGELGSDAPNDSSTPLQVTAVVLGSIVEEIAAGADYTCARNANGAVYCFGANTYGQLGDGTANPATMPTKVLLGVCP